MRGGGGRQLRVTSVRGGEGEGLEREREREREREFDECA